ncbi:hypothetical protein FIBSPDRAFT_485437 [Athelia psychrophila]|uniref:Uncharacterized protein n=1 Tax=Athelia psychrophila TaxID=1759441 RepID=A0A166KWE0_9AGAM|nr:hypothetical protein FIBSPDRAFT_485437 [Fibularhizoctonia sp. CBS 109695]
MKFSAVSLLVLGAGVAQHATASPIRVILTELTTFHPSAADNNVAHVDGVRVGLPMPHSFISTEQADELSKEAHRRPCAMKKYKGMSLSNAFRQAMGLPLIEKNISPEQADKMVHGGLLRIMPIHNVGDDEHQSGRVGKWHHVGDDEKKVHHEHEHDGQLGRHGKHHAHAHAHHGHMGFLHRIHRALASLGPWEGRAVAFVIGCGLGVLLRMLFVLVVVAVRAVKGGNASDEEVEYREIILVTDATEVVVAPPQYEYVDEKRPVEKEEEEQKTAQV